MTTSFDFSTRYSGTAAIAPDFGISDHGPLIIDSVSKAEALFIDDPMSFPWELLDDSSAVPIVIDIGSCSADQITALRPVLGSLTEHDTIVNRANLDDAESLKLASELGVRSTEPASESFADLRTAKYLDRAEDYVISRLELEWQIYVIELADVQTTDWSTTRWSEPDSDLPAAIVVRLPGKVVRANRSGFVESAAILIEQVDGTEILDVRGIRTAPGAPLDRALIVVGVDR